MDLDLDITSEIYNGKSNGKCSAPDFLSCIGRVGRADAVCREFLREKESHQLRVFWYPTDTNEGDTSLKASTSTSGISASAMSPQSRSVQEEIKCFLLSLRFWRDDMIVQLWAPRRTHSGETVLSLSEQPFGVGELYNGLCKYRLHCIETELSGRPRVMPVEKAFLNKTPEIQSNIGSYSEEEFSSRSFAIGCGIVGYAALPLLEQQCDGDQQQQCIGVLEFLSFHKRVYPDFWSLEDLGLASVSSHFHGCKKKRRDLLHSEVDIYDMLRFMRKKLRLHLVQVWIPCKCNDGLDENSCGFSSAAAETSQLFCDLTCIDWDMKYSWDFIRSNLLYGTYSLKNGMGLVGKAYSKNKSFYIGDASKLSISDYPLVCSSGLAACYAIPLGVMNPKLSPLILEVFLPPQQNCDGNPGDLLESLLSRIAKRLSKHNVAYKSKRLGTFCVKMSDRDEDNFVYFNVNRSGKTMNNAEAFEENGREEQLSRSSYKPPNLEDISQQCYETDDAADNNAYSNNINAQNAADTFRNGENEMKVDIHEQPLGRSERREQQFPSAHLPPILGANDHPNTQDIAIMTTGSREACSTGEITLDSIYKLFGRFQLKDAAQEFGVSPSTLKRKCRSLGIKRWKSRMPKYNRNKVIESNPTRSVEGDAEAIQESQMEHCNARKKEAADVNSISAGAMGNSIIATGNHDIDGSYSLIVKATYSEDTVKFSFSRKSGIEELRRELNRRFELTTKRFKIKYKEDDEWIMVSCDEDLQYHIRTLETSSSGKTVMNLSIFP